MSKKLIPFIVRQKFRFDWGQNFLMLLNLGLLAIAGAPTLSRVIGIRESVVVYVVAPTTIIGTWFVGYILDRLKVTDAYYDEMNSRNKIIKSLEK